ncbi:MAG: LPP20 family lipoprotein [Treponema sp.]|nr:LPP20 family lipoprotein [Treponema sp.]
MIGEFAALNAQTKPAWVNNPSAVYSSQLYVSATGAGAGRQDAGRNAIAALTSFFKQSVSSRVSIIDRERQVDGSSASESNMSQSIESSAMLDNLMGAEIREAWNDTVNRIWYAVAVMEKDKCTGLYNAELDKIAGEIESLIAAPEGITFEAIPRCKRARELVPKADTCALVLLMLDGQNRQPEISLLAEEINAALDRARSIPVDVRVQGDSEGRIRAAFANALSAEGFKTGGRSSRFAVEAALSTFPAPKTLYFNTRYTVDAALVDTSTGAELFTFNITGRESHPASQEDEDSRVLVGVRRKIAEDFPVALREYINSIY